MTKNPRRKQKSTRRSASTNQHPAQEILKAKSRTSTSSGPVLRSSKRRFIRRILRRGAELDTAELLDRVAPYVSTSKRILDEDIERSEESDINELRKLPKSPSSPYCKLLKSKVKAKAKCNTANSVKLMKFSSERHNIVAPCFDESNIMIHTSAQLKDTYHKGMKEEDCDSTDSYIQLGQEKGLRHLFSALKARPIQSKPIARESSASNLSQLEYEPKLRTRASTPSKDRIRSRECGRKVDASKHYK